MIYCSNCVTVAVSINLLKDKVEELSRLGLKAEVRNGRIKTQTILDRQNMDIEPVSR